MSDPKYTGREIIEITPPAGSSVAEYSIRETGHFIIGNIGRCLNCGLYWGDDLPDTCSKDITPDMRAEIEWMMREVMK